jgi:predicted transcriptional regulator
MNEKYLLFALDDEKSKKLGEVISSATCKKIANFLAEKEASENDISKELKMPINTVEYNLKKLLAAGVIEKSKNYFWSKKGKKIDMYKVANKLIVISPKKTNVYSKLKNIIPVVLISIIATAFIALYNSKSLFQRSDVVVEKVLNAAPQELATVSNSHPWIWFGLGSLVAIIVFLIWVWKKL